MKTIKRIFLVGFMVTIVVTAFYARKVEAKSKSKSSVVYTLKKGTLTVKGKGAMTKNMVFKGNKKIKKVVIKKGVTSVIGRAFENCSELKSVEIGDNVKTVGKYAFYNCKKLKSVKIGNKVEAIGKYAFGKAAITRITIPKSINKIGLYAFTSCKKLKTVNMPGKYIKVPAIPDDEYSRFLPHVKTIKFSTSLSIKAVTYYNTENYIVNKHDKHYKSIDGVIYTKDGKRTVRLPNRQTVNIAEGCMEFTMESIMYSGYLGDDMYVYNCYSLKRLILPETVNKILIGKNFDNNYNNPQFPNAVQSLELESVIIKNKKISQDCINLFMRPFSEDFTVKYVESVNSDNVIKFTKEEK